MNDRDLGRGTVRCGRRGLMMVLVRRRYLFRGVPFAAVLHQQAANTETVLLLLLVRGRFLRRRRLLLLHTTVTGTAVRLIPLVPV